MKPSHIMQYTVRMQSDLYHRLWQLAKEKDISFNQLCIEYLEDGVAKENEDNKEK